MYESTATVQNKNIVAVLWKDNRLVTSTFSGMIPISEVKRYSKKNLFWSHFPILLVFTINTWVVSICWILTLEDTKLVLKVENGT